MSSALQLDPEDIRYGCMVGGESVREALARFVNHFLRVPEALHIRAGDVVVGGIAWNHALYERITPSRSHHALLHLQHSPRATFAQLTNGCGSAVESLFHVLCDEGDGVLLPAPAYGGFDMDVERRARVQLVHVHGRSVDGYAVHEHDLVEALRKARARDINVRALLIMNPVNPTGRVYSATTIRIMAEFCAREQLHFVVDEIYALSVFREHGTADGLDDVDAALQVISPTAESSSFAPFTSVLTMDVLPCPERIHWLWSFSKDFCVNGFRAGVLVSRNPTIVSAMDELGYFTSTPSVVQKLLRDMVVDLPWCETFFRTNCNRLADAYGYVVGRLVEFNRDFTAKYGGNRVGFPLRYLPATGGFFLWVDLSYFVLECQPPMAVDGQQSRTVVLDATNTTSNIVAYNAAVAKERALFLRLIREGSVYIAPGSVAFHDAEVGWFRIIFAARRPILKLALDRLFGVLWSVAAEAASRVMK